MNEAVIETRGLRKSFGPKLAVADLSLTVGRGEVFGFLGPNGAGKTTSLKMLLGLIPPTAGRATVLGAPIGDRRTRGRLGFLPEHFRFHDWLTGRELLHFHGRLQGLSGIRLRSRVEQLLEQVDLNDAAGRKVREYSKGMLQRIGLAQALVHEPELVFLDEPTSGLDPLGRLLVRDLIRDLSGRGVAVFLNSHLLGEVEATCDRVVFIKQGRTIHEMKLADAPASLEVELRLADAGPETLSGLHGFGEVVSAGDGDGARSGSAAPGSAAPSGAGITSARLRISSEDRLPELAGWLVARGARLYEMRTIRRSLESTFLEVMGDDQRPG